MLEIIKYLKWCENEQILIDTKYLTTLAREYNINLK